MNKFYWADLHLGHKNVIKFTDNSGNIPRKFDSIEDHDEWIIDTINRVCDPRSTLYILGDVSLSRKGLIKLGAVKCGMVLIKGNHDTLRLSEYMQFFRDVRAYKTINAKPEGEIICSHIPLHPNQQGRYIKNVHGHLHANSMNDPFYRCVSVEQAMSGPIEESEL